MVHHRVMVHHGRMLHHHLVVHHLLVHHLRVCHLWVLGLGRRHGGGEQSKNCNCDDGLYFHFFLLAAIWQD